MDKQFKDLYDSGEGTRNFRELYKLSSSGVRVFKLNLYTQYVASKIKFLPIRLLVQYWFQLSVISIFLGVMNHHFLFKSALDLFEHRSLMTEMPLSTWLVGAISNLPIQIQGTILSNYVSVISVVFITVIFAVVALLIKAIKLLISFLFFLWLVLVLMYEIIASESAILTNIDSWVRRKFSTVKNKLFT